MSAASAFVPLWDGGQDPCLVHISTARPPGGFKRLEAVERGAIAVAHLAVFPNTENPVQIDARDGHEGGTPLSGGNRETGIVAGNIDIPQKAIGGLRRADPLERQLLRQAVLERLEQPLRAAAGLAGE